MEATAWYESFVQIGTPRSWPRSCHCLDPTGVTKFMVDAAGNQQIEQAPAGVTTNVWDYENQRTAVLLPSGVRETMTYSADLRQHSMEV